MLAYRFELAEAVAQGTVDPNAALVTTYSLVPQQLPALDAARVSTLLEGMDDVRLAVSVFKTVIGDPPPPEYTAGPMFTSSQGSSNVIVNVTSGAMNDPL